MLKFLPLTLFACLLVLPGLALAGEPPASAPALAPVSALPTVSALPSSTPHSQFLTPAQSKILEQRFGLTPEAPTLNQDVNTPPTLGRDYGRLRSPVVSPASSSGSPSASDDSDSAGSDSADSSPTDSFFSSSASSPSAPVVTVRFFFRYDRPSAMAYQVFKLWRAQAPANVKFTVSIASSGTTFENFGARVFYALVLLKQEERLRGPLFEAIAAKKLTMSSPVQLTNWLVNHGIDKDKFIKIINSPEDIALAASAIDTTQAYEVTTTPFIVIDGQYWVRPSLNMTPLHFIQIADYLVEGLARPQAGSTTPASGSSD